MITLTHYTPIALLYKTPHSEFWHATRLQDNREVVLEIRNAGLNDQNLRHIHHLLHDKYIPQSSPILDFIQENSRSILVYAYFPGKLLSHILDGEPLPLQTVLEIALSVSHAVEALHQAGFIHGNLSPSSVVYNANKQMIQLIDFSSVCRIDHTEDRPHYHEDIDYLAYISPEQTGRVDRPVDIRSDFYGLGCLFYTLLAHKPPFISTDPLEMIHAHVALPVPSLISRHIDVPEAIELIILKLLSKEPNDRYQTITGLIADWQYCLSAIESGTDLDKFIPGSFDHVNIIRMPDQLYGRQKELALLSKWLHQAVTDQSRMILISGYSGVGKTSLVNHLAELIKQEQGFFVSGKFEEYRRNIPYFAIAQAIERLCQKWLLLDTKDLDRIRGKIQAVVGHQGQALVDIIPSLETIIGPQSELMPLGSIESQNRIDHLFQQFFVTICEPDRPLLLFIDDVQWADYSSFRILNQVLTSEAKHLLIIACYRSNEVDEHHAMTLSINHLEQIRPDCISHLQIDNLSPKATKALVASMLDIPVEESAELSTLTYKKTEGNPFYTIEFIKLLHTEHLLAFDHKLARWSWNIDRIALYRPGDNVVDVVIQKIRFLPEETLNVLKIAACTGREFTLATLAHVLNTSLITIYNALVPAIDNAVIASENLPSPVTEDNLLASTSAFFLHDRLQEGSYRLMAEEEAIHNHLLLGQSLYAMYHQDPEALDHHLMSIIDHFNQSLDLLSPEYQLIAARLNHQAGLKAKASSANAQAIHCFEITLSLLGESAWTTQYDMMMSAAKNLYICYYLTNEYDKADLLFTRLTGNAKTAQDQFEVYYNRMVQCMVITDFKSTLETGRQFIHLLGHHLPEPDEIDAALVTEEAKLTENFDRFGPESLIDPIAIAPTEVSHYALALIRLQLMGYFVNYEIFRYASAKALNLAFEHGKFSGMESLLSNYVMHLLNLQQYEFADQILQIAKQVADKNNGLKSEIWHFQSASVDLWVNTWEDSLQNYHTTIAYCSEEGNQEYIGYALDTLVNDILCKGEPLAAFEKEVDHVLVQLRRIQHYVMSTGIGMYRQFIKCIRGETLSADSFNDDQFLEDDYIQPNLENSLLLAYIYGFKNFALYVNGEYDAAYQMALLGKPNRETVGCFHHVIYLKLYAALTYPLVADRLDGQEKEDMLSDWDTILDWFDRLSKLSPRNYLNKVTLIRADKAAYEGDFKTALINYEDSINHAKQYNTLHEAAFACERLARFWLSHNRHAQAIDYLRQAVSYYQEWGATLKIERLKTEFPELVHDSSMTLYKTSKANELISHIKLDGESILKTSYALSGEVYLNSLMEKLLHIVLENAGADFAALLLVEDEDIHLEICQSLLDPNKTSKEPIPFADIDDAFLPKTILLYVIRSQSQVLLNLPNDHPYSDDPYFKKRPDNPRSLLCAPITYRGKIICLLYLENHQMSGVFNNERLQLLRMIATQAAVAIQNASLFNKLDNYRRTLDERVKEHGEHMGTLIAGIAHEINTPVGIALTTITHAHYESNDIINAFKAGKLSKQKLDSFFTMIQEGFDIMEQSLNRTVDLIKNFHRLSLDQSLGEAKEFDLVDYINKILYYLKPILKKSSPTVALTGNGPLMVYSYPGAFPQLFTNLINNSMIHAFESFAPGQGRIDIEVTEENKEMVKLVYKDNGNGMPAETAARIFEPLFTTKASSGGSGLGGHIINTLVHEQLHGNITCESTPSKGTTFTLIFPKKFSNSEQ